MSLVDVARRAAFTLSCRRFKGSALEDEAGAWYMGPKPLMWAYAGGGALRKYGNAAEDIDESIRSGFKVIEVDFARTSDGIPAATHFFKPEDSDSEWDHVPTAAEFKGRKVNGKCTPLLFDDLVSRYRDSGVYFALDPFYYHCNVRNGEADFREYVISHTTERERRQMILQIYGFKTLCSMKAEWGFGGLHYVIGVGNIWKVEHLIPVLTEVGVHSVSLQNSEMTSSAFRAVGLLRSANIHVSVAGVNTMQRYREVAKAGADCINTMKLSPRELLYESVDGRGV